jgi:ankyrin repeat protein
VDRLLERRPQVPPEALHSALQGGNVAIVRRFLERGANPNERRARDQGTPLHGVARKLSTRPCDKHAEAVKLLLEAGADPTLKDGQGLTPFDRANRWPEHKELIPLLSP